MRIARATTLALVSITYARPQDGNVRFPRFADYRAGEFFSGKPAEPKLVRPRERLFRTKIREGAAKGANFAGHYAIAEWGCGSSCVSIAVVDVKTGDVFPGPFGSLGYGAVLICRYFRGQVGDALVSTSESIARRAGMPRGQKLWLLFLRVAGTDFPLGAEAR